MSDQAETPDEDVVPSEPTLHQTILAALRATSLHDVLLALSGATQEWLSEDYDINDTRPPQPSYPYVDGDFLILGPEIFTSMPGLPGHAEGVISWKGENYVIQPPAGAGG